MHLALTLSLSLTQSSLFVFRPLYDLDQQTTIVHVHRCSDQSDSVQNYEIGTAILPSVDTTAFA